MRTRAIGMAALLSLAVSAAVGGALPASAAPADQQAEQRYIVKTDSGSATSGVAQEVRDSGGSVDNVYTEVLTGFSATMSAEQASDLRDDQQVQSITPDRRFHSSGVQTNPTWGLDRIDQRSASRNGSYRYTTTGAGVTAFVVDTGIRTNHSQFGSRATSGYDFVDGDRSATDCEGHGTHVSGTIGGSTYGAAKGVKLVSVRVLDCEGYGWASDIIDGMDWIIAHKPKGPSVVNMSIGGGSYQLIDRAVERTIAAGIPVVVAAGNEGADACGSSPARVPSAITVAATDSHDERPYWSNYGRCVDVFAPGADVRSASITSTTASEVMSGTSMATPHVVGLVARYLQAHPRATPAQAAAAVAADATTNVVKFADGSPNRLLYAKPPVVAPGKPDKVAVSTSNKAKSATIRWAAPRDNGGAAVKAYRVTRNGKDAKGAGPKTVTVSAQTRKHTFTRLKKGYAYTLTVRAVSSVGTGSAVSKRAAKLR